MTYVKTWSRATRAERAQREDLQLLQDQQTMQDDVDAVAEAKQVQVAMKQHLWYLCETLGGLDFFE